jgi:hypothetical protein
LSEVRSIGNRFTALKDLYPYLPDDDERFNQDDYPMLFTEGGKSQTDWRQLPTIAKDETTLFNERIQYIMQRMKVYIYDDVIYRRLNN